MGLLICMINIKNEGEFNDKGENHYAIILSTSNQQGNFKCREMKQYAFWVNTASSLDLNTTNIEG